MQWFRTLNNEIACDRIKTETFYNYAQVVCNSQRFLFIKTVFVHYYFIAVHCMVTDCFSCTGSVIRAANNFFPFKGHASD